MARKPRVQFPGALYHIIGRGNQQQEIFLHDEDYSRYINYLSDYHHRFHFILYAFVLMPNHIHLMLETGEIPLSKIMQCLQLRYAQYYNRKYKKNGHLFQGRYKSIVCDRDTYLLELIRYLHLNPVRGGIVTRPGDYPWSSHQIYIGKKKAEWVDTEFILSQFGKEKRGSIKRYQRFIFEGLRMGHREDYYEVVDQYYLGDNTFIDQMSRKRKEHEKEGRLLRIPLVEIEDLISQKMGMPKEIFHSISRNRRAAKARSIIAYLGRTIARYKLKDLANHFNRDPMTLSVGIRRLEMEMIEKESVKELIRELQENLLTLKR
jgi:REP element-mobilizing transposase RayT